MKLNWLVDRVGTKDGLVEQNNTLESLEDNSGDGDGGDSDQEADCDGGGDGGDGESDEGIHRLHSSCHGDLL